MDFHLRFVRLSSGPSDDANVDPFADPVRSRSRNERQSAAGRRRASALSAAAGLSLLAAGCGGSAGSHVAQLGTTATQASAASASGGSSTSGPTVAQAVAYADCMRSNGVPDWPDPDSSGVFDKSKLTLQQLGVSGSRLQSAQTACKHLAPNGGQPPNQSQLQQMKTQALQFSRCVRAHGVPNFPDPDSAGRIPDPASVGIDQGAPKFQAANQACGKYRPPYMPSNAAYNAYARTHGG
jgi:hypothetical protein